MPSELRVGVRSAATIFFVGPKRSLEARIIFEHPPPLNLTRKLVDILEDNAARKARVPTAPDRTFDYHPKWEDPSGIPKEETRSKNQRTQYKS
jgi:hypothetical protein